MQNYKNDNFYWHWAKMTLWQRVIDVYKHYSHNKFVMKTDGKTKTGTIKPQQLSLKYNNQKHVFNKKHNFETIK